MDRIEHLRGMNNRVSSLYPRFREMMESNDYAGLDQCLAGMDALDEEFAEAVKQQIILRAEDVSDMRRALLYLNLLNETRTMIPQGSSFGENSAEICSWLVKACNSRLRRRRLLPAQRKRERHFLIRKFSRNTREAGMGEIYFPESESLRNARLFKV